MNPQDGTYHEDAYKIPPKMILDFFLSVHLTPASFVLNLFVLKYVGHNITIH